MPAFDIIKNEVKFYIAGVLRCFSPPGVKSLENWSEYKICWFGVIYCAEWMIKKIAFAVVLPVVAPFVFLFVEMMTLYEIISTPIKAPFQIYSAIKIFKQKRAEKNCA